jgi:hypothetical protein
VQPHTLGAQLVGYVAQREGLQLVKVEVLAATCIPEKLKLGGNGTTHGQNLWSTKKESV